MRIRITDPVLRSHVARAIVFERLGRDIRRKLGECCATDRTYWQTVGAVIRIGEQLQEAGVRGQTATSA